MSRFDSLRNAVTEKTFDIIILLAFAAIVRIPALFYGTRLITTDGARYVRLGSNLIAGKGFISFRGTPDLLTSPLYPALVGIATLFFPENPTLAARSVSFVAGTLVVIPAYWLAQSVYSRCVGIATGLLSGSYVGIVMYSATAMTEALFGLLVVTLALLIFRVNKSKKWHLYPVVGAITALAFLTKSEALPYLAAIPVLSIVYQLWDTSDWRTEIINRHHGLAIASYIAAFFIIAAPYLLYLYGQYGHLTFGSKASINLVVGELVTASDPLHYEKVIYGLTEDGTELKYAPGAWSRPGPSPLHYILANPVDLAIRYFNNVKWLYLGVIPAVFPPLVLAFGAIGMYDGDYQDDRVLLALVTFIILGIPFAVYPLFKIHDRYLFPYIPLISIYIAVGIIRVGDRISTRRLRSICSRFTTLSISTNTLTTAFVLFLVVGTLLTAVGFEIVERDHQESAHQVAGEWLKGQASDSALVMARKPFVAYYAGTRSIRLPYANYSELEHFARTNDVDYLVIDVETFQSVRPQLAFMTNGSYWIEDDFKRVHSVKRDREVYIYELIEQE